MSTDQRKTAFEIVAAYFVNIYDNELYQKAKIRKEAGNSPSITESYSECVTCYLHAFRDKSNKNEESYYRKIVRDLLGYYQGWSSYTTVTLSEFINTIVMHLTPREKYISMDNFAKDRLLRDSLTAVVTRFTIEVLHKHLRIVIDNRDSESRNVRALQNTFIELMDNQRQHIFELFIEAGAGPEGRKRAEGVSVAVVTKLKELLKRTVDEKCALQNKLANYNQNTKNVIEQLKEQIRFRDKEIEEKDDQICELEHALVDMNKKLANITPLIRNEKEQSEEEEFIKNDQEEDNIDEDESEEEDDISEGSSDKDDNEGESSGITEATTTSEQPQTTRERRKKVNFTLPEDDDFSFLDF